MGQKGFFDVERRLEAISAKGDPLETIKTIVRWEDFRADIEAVTETKPEERKSNAGRKPYDTILKFKIVVLQSLHNLSDEQTEYLIRDRLSFIRFLDLELEDPVPDATTIWLFREALAQAVIVQGFFGPYSKRIAQLAISHRIGYMSSDRSAVVDGGLVSISANFPLLYEYAAVYVDKLLKGANPASLPVEQPSKFQVTVNSKTAQALGLSLSPIFLAQIDEVIE